MGRSERAKSVVKVCRYRLLKDLPGYPKGTEFERDEELRDNWQLTHNSWGVDDDGYKWTRSYVESVPDIAYLLESHHKDRNWFEPIFEDNPNERRLKE